MNKLLIYICLVIIWAWILYMYHDHVCVEANLNISLHRNVENIYCGSYPVCHNDSYSCIRNETYACYIVDKNCIWFPTCHSDPSSSIYPCINNSASICYF